MLLMHFRNHKLHSPNYPITMHISKNIHCKHFLLLPNCNVLNNIVFLTIGMWLAARVTCIMVITSSVHCNQPLLKNFFSGRLLHCMHKYTNCFTTVSSKRKVNKKRLDHVGGVSCDCFIIIFIINRNLLWD